VSRIGDIDLSVHGNLDIQSKVLTGIPCHLPLDFVFIFSVSARKTRRVHGQVMHLGGASECNHSTPIDATRKFQTCISLDIYFNIRVCSKRQCTPYSTRKSTVISHKVSRNTASTMTSVKLRQNITGTWKTCSHGNAASDICKHCRQTRTTSFPSF